MTAEILIKGLEMPKQNECVWIRLHGDGSVYKHMGQEYFKVGEAVALPPHGKLKDTDDIVNRLALKPCHDAMSTLLSVQAAIDESETVLEASK